METSQRVRAHIWISGVVQGVNYRAFAREEARRRHVCGGVRNLSDGRVEVEIEGDKQAVEATIEALRKGPPLAIVESLDIEWRTTGAGYRDFKIWMT